MSLTRTLSCLIAASAVLAVQMPVLAQCPVSFAGAVSYPIGGNPQSVAVGDFNGDGLPDVVVTTSDTNNFSVLLGSGGGLFHTAVNHALGPNPGGVVVGDFNHDGHLDIAVVMGGVSPDYEGTIAILLGNGDGTFQAATNFPVGQHLGDLAIGDFNGDGVPDLAVANFLSLSVSVLLGVGNGTFHTAVSYAAGSYPEFIAVGDFNGDGHTDLATSNDFASGSVTVRGITRSCG